MIFLYMYDGLLLVLFGVLATLAYRLIRRSGSSPQPGDGLKNAEAEFLTRYNPVNWW